MFHKCNRHVANSFAGKRKSYHLWEKNLYATTLNTVSVQEAALLPTFQEVERSIYR